MVTTQGYYNRTRLTSHTTKPFDSRTGDLIVICASSHSGAILVPSDKYKNVWNSVAGPTNSTIGNNLRTQVWYSKTLAVGPDETITMKLSIPQSLVLSTIVVKGSSASNPIDAVTEITEGRGRRWAHAISSPGFATTGRNDLVIGFAKSSVSEAWIHGDGFNLQPAASSDYLVAETGWAPIPGRYNSTFHLTNSGNWQAVAVAVKGSAVCSVGSC